MAGKAQASPIRWWEMPSNEARHNVVLWASYVPRKNVTPTLETLPEDSCIGRVIRSGHDWEGWLSPYLERYCDAAAVSIDIGANIGAHTVTMAEHSGYVYAFEPQKRVFDVLGRNTARFPNVTLVNAGVSDAGGTAHLDERTDGNVGMASITAGGTGEEIALTRLDDINFPARVAFMKIDAELHEREVLAGGAETIKRDRPVIIIEDQTNAREFLVGIGYTCKRISLHDFVCLP